MDVWWTYRLEDLLLFSPRVYYRLFALHNQALWPAQFVVLLAGLVLLGCMVRPGPAGQRLMPLLLGLAWLWVGWSFLWQRYATINWAIEYVAPAFWLEGLALLGVAVSRRGLALPAGSWRTWLAALLFAMALLGYPLLAPLAGRSWGAAALLGFMPDPTAVATLAVLCLAPRRTAWLLLPIPLLWCAITGATLWGLGAGEWFAAPLGALLALCLRLVPGPSATREMV